MQIQTTVTKEHAELMSFLKTISVTMEKNVTESRKQIDSLKTDNKKLREDFKKQTDSLKAESKKQTDNLRSDFKKLQIKMDVVIKDRVAKPEDKGKFQVLAIYATGEEYSIDKDDVQRFPYMITKCQTQLLPVNEKKIQKKYENARKIFSINNPSAESLFQVLKEKVEKQNMGIVFYHSGIYFTDNNYNINDVTKLVMKIDKERTNV